jgi:hypothetical protein
MSANLIKISFAATMLMSLANAVTLKANCDDQQLETVQETEIVLAEVE